MRGGGTQMGNTTTNDLEEGDGAGATRGRGANLDAEGVKQAILQPTN